MVYTSEGSGERDSSVRAEIFMEARPKRSNPLHNFSLPSLKWGSQRHLLCVKVDSACGSQSPSWSTGIDFTPPMTAPIDERRRSGDAVVRKSRTGSGINCSGEEIKAVKEKFLIDLRAEMDKIRDEYLRIGVESGEAAEQSKEDSPVRPWNLRTRRAACKAPIGMADRGKARTGHSPSEGGNNNLCSLLKGREERAKFYLRLKRKEVDEDFTKMTGRRPPRKPKKRSRAIQKQLDRMMPGLWLTEVTLNTYQVPEIPENAKR
ncbi:hypothetical protein SAY87_025108 [Trapa incisa]|uniref:Uncharacterized protein n=1 Tax=Trapa incisa TaxID=236973 RepID=A0AAN7JGA2_9MYRT|nr:hypothetical protein SAY87_025108 [Trapa incisa]